MKMKEENMWRRKKKQKIKDKEDNEWRKRKIKEYLKASNNID